MGWGWNELGVADGAGLWPSTARARAMGEPPWLQPSMFRRCRPSDETLPSELTLFDLATGTPLLGYEQWALIQSVCRVVSLTEPDD